MYLDVNPTIFEALPPGHNSHELDSSSFSEERPLRLFYVGGISNHYQLHKLFEAVRDLPKIELTICTREKEWLSVKHEYPKLTSNIKIIHKSGSDMEVHLRDCDVAVLFVKPQEYREFASPVKLYEYLGYQKPILASEGTLAGRFVREQGVGWTVQYDVQKVKAFLLTFSLTGKLEFLFYRTLKELPQTIPGKQGQSKLFKPTPRCENSTYGCSQFHPYSPLGHSWAE